MALDSERIQKNVQKLRKILKKAPKRPTPGEIHELRTRIRRFETTVEALALSSKRNERALLRRLKRIRKRAGKIRDMDVLTWHLSSAQVAKEQDCVVQLLEYLGARRYKEVGRLKQIIRKDGSTARWRLKRTSGRLAELVGENNKELSDQQAPARAEATAAALQHSEELMTPEILNRGNLHPYRLKVKQLRDVLRMAANDADEKFVNKLGEVKDSIGEWHDWEELIAIAAKVLDHAPRCSLLRKLKSISNENFERALSLTNSMRKDYLRSAGRRTLRSKRHRGPTAPVLKASSAIAA